MTVHGGSSAKELHCFLTIPHWTHEIGVWQDMRFNRRVDLSQLRSFLDSFVEFLTHEAMKLVIRMNTIHKHIGLDGGHVDEIQ